MEYSKFPQRKSPRLQNFDYATPNYYFVTICADQKKKLFGNEQCLNLYGQIAENEFSEIMKHLPTVAIDKFVVMPNHVHVIIILEDSTIKLSTVIGQYKSVVSRKIHKYDADLKVWQKSYHDHVIRNQESYEKIWSYIDTNPIKWSEDCYFE